MSWIASDQLWRYVCVALLGAGVCAASMTFLGNSGCDGELEPLMVRGEGFEARILSQVGELGIQIEELASRMEVYSGLINLRREGAVPAARGGASEVENPNGSNTYLWLSVLPKAVGRELVLRGLSPYDSPEVAGFVQEVCRGIDAADSNYRASVIRNNEEYSGGRISNSNFKLLQERIRNEYDTILLEAMSGFSACLDAIDE